MVGPTASRQRTWDPHLQHISHPSSRPGRALGLIHRFELPRPWLRLPVLRHVLKGLPWAPHVCPHPVTTPPVSDLLSQGEHTAKVVLILTLWPVT